MRNNVRRRDILQGLALVCSLGLLPISARAKRMPDKEVEWQEVPRFHNGMRLEAKPFQDLGAAIVQLQHENEVLKKMVLNAR